MQISGDGTTAGERSSQHALRALLILGGLVAVWWALMTGVAHAESTPHHGLVDQVRSQLQVQQHHQQPVRDVVRRVHHDVQATTAKARHEVARTRQTIKPVTHSVTRKVSTVVDSTPLAPVTHKVTQKATQTLHTTVSTTVATTQALVSKTGADPVVGAVVGTVEDSVQGDIVDPESSVQQGDSHSTQHSGQHAEQHPGQVVESTTSDLLAATSGQQSVTADRHQASTDANGPAQAPRGTPSLPDPCSSPSGSGSSSFTPVGITESSLLVVPTVLRDHHTWSLARLHAGPAFKPSSSPD